MNPVVKSLEALQSFAGIHSTDLGLVCSVLKIARMAMAGRGRRQLRRYVELLDLHVRKVDAAATN